MLQVFTNANFPLMGRVKWYFIAFSVLAVAASIGTMAIKGFNYGIDFAGGTAVQLKFRERPSVEAMRSALEKAGLGDISIQRIGDPDDNEVLIRVEQKTPVAGAGSEGGEVSTAILDALRGPEDKATDRAGRIDLNMASEIDLRDWLSARLPAPAGGSATLDPQAVARAVVGHRTEHAGLIGDLAEIASIPGVPPEAARLLQEQGVVGAFALRGVEFVGPTAGHELLQNTLMAVCLASGLILVYVWVRFHKWTWGLMGVLALVHDVIIAAGAMALTGKEFSLPVVAALLTILGYSINDTIVVFDRIRENLRLYREVDFEEVVNASINQTLSRTILTSFTVFIALMALFLYGGDKLNPLSFCLLVGVVFGTYSSIFVASALLVVVYRRFGAKYVRA